MKPHYHVGTNLPGYLPTTAEPSVAYSDWTAAQSALATELEHEATLADAPENLHYHNATALSEAAQSVSHAARGCEFSLVMGDATGATRAWWLDQCDDPTCELAQ